jgi:hypothetical protein
LERYWGVDPEQVVGLEKDLATYQQQTRRAGAGRPTPSGGPGAAAKYIPTEQYDKRNIDGWTVYVSPRLAARPGLCATMVTLLNYKLHMIDHFIVEQGRQQLHEAPSSMLTKPGGA